MHNTIAQLTIDRSKTYKTPQSQLDFLQGCLRVHFCEDTQEHCLQLTSNPSDIFCLHNNEEIDLDIEKDQEDVVEFMRLTKKLRKEVGDL